MTNYKEKPRPFKLLETGVRNRYQNPIVEGGMIYPRSFRYWKDGTSACHPNRRGSDIVIIAACGERANEVVGPYGVSELVDLHTDVS